jgi:stress response protein YsnF
VVEVRETAEEPVVSKAAHVAEKVVMGREATERTETVRDTVRRDKVEVNNGLRASGKSWTQGGAGFGNPRSAIALR